MLRSPKTDSRCPSPLALATGLALCTCPTPAAIVLWDGSCGGTSWSQVCGPQNSMSNWNNDSLPTLGDSVSLPMGAPLVQCFSDCLAGTISCQPGLSILSAGGLEVNSGSITSLTMDSLSASGLKINGGEVTLVGNTNWVQGRASGTGNLKNTGNFSGSPQIIGTVDFTNDAGASASFRSLVIIPGATVTNASGGTMSLTPISNTAQLPSSGDGILTNHGQFITANGTGTTIDVGVKFMQDTGSFTVTGNTGALGTRMLNDSTFTGGTLTISDNSKLRFQNVSGFGLVHTFNGIQTVSGNGNMYIETPDNSEWRLDNDDGVAVNLSGTDGLVLAATYITLTGVLKNQGKAWWQGGRIRPNADCGFCAPEFRNEGNLLIATSNVQLDTFLRNMSGGTVVHSTGNVALGEDGLISNDGTYEQRRGSIRRQLPTQEFGSFNNVGTYVRPNHADTQNVQNEVPFVLNAGSNARFEMADTNFAGPAFSGLDFLGGDMEIQTNAVVRVGRASVEGENSDVVGTGQFHIGGFGQGPTFTINAGSRLECTLGPDKDGGSDAGTYLVVGGRIGGTGELLNEYRLYWSGGSIGFNGAGRVRNDEEGTTLLTGGTINSGGHFFNDGEGPGDGDDFGLVKQTGTLTLNGGLVTNSGDWEVEAGTTIQGFSTHEFLNTFSGNFVNEIAPTQSTQVSSRFNNQGLVRAKSGTLQFTGTVVQLNAGTLNGGLWQVDPGATLDLPGTLTQIGPDTRIDRRGTWTDLENVTLNQGSLLQDGGEFNNSPVSNEGEMIFETESGIPFEIQGGSGTLNNSTLGYMNEPEFVPVVAGGPPVFAVRCANLNNSGTVGPGGPGAAGPFRLDGNFVQSSPNAVLEIELGGETPVDEHDQLIVDGNVLLDGHLQVHVLPTYFPEGGEQFTIITATNGVVAGAFDSIDGPGQYSLSYSPTSVTLTLINPPHTGDVNGDGETDVDDLLSVIVAWGVCPPAPTFCAADLTGDGFVDVDDLLVVIINWG